MTEPTGLAGPAAPHRNRRRGISLRPNRTILLAAAALAAGTAPALAADTTPALAAGTTERASVSSSGAQGDGESALPSISAHGRYVAFVSAASNLVPNDTNGSNCPGRFEVCGFDVFVRDLKAGTTERVSVSSAGAQGDGDSGAGNFGTAGPAISADGRYVAFASVATDLVPGDTNGRSDVFVRDRQTGTTERVSVSSSGQQANFGGGSGDIESSAPAISADGRYVAFASIATNLVP